MAQRIFCERQPRDVFLFYQKHSVPNSSISPFLVPYHDLTYWRFQILFHTAKDSSRQKLSGMKHSAERAKISARVICNLLITLIFWDKCYLLSAGVVPQANQETYFVPIPISLPSLSAESISIQNNKKLSIIIKNQSNSE